MNIIQTVINSNLKTAFALIAAITFVLGLPTLFIDYYDVDLLTSFLYSKNQFAGLPTDMNKGIVYHSIMNFSFSLFGLKLTSFHLMGIFIRLATSFFIYLLAKEMYDRKTGVLAALLYCVYTYAFNRQFMTVNGEIVYNLFFAMTFYFFYLFDFRNLKFALILFAVSAVLALFTKFQGLWCLAAVVLFFAGVKPFYVMNISKRKRYFALIAGFLFLLAGVFLMLLFFRSEFAALKESFSGKFNEFFMYLTARGFDFFYFIGKLIHRVGMLAIYNNLIFVFSCLFLIRFFKSKKREQQEAYLVTILLVLFAVIFLGGQRLYYHYFLQLYPVLAIMGAKEIVDRFQIKNFRKITQKLLLIPVLLVFLWNVKDVLTVKFFPDLLYKETKAMYILRVMVFGQYDDYLLPYRNFRASYEYLKQNSDEKQTLFVWPEGAEYLAYAGRPTATLGFWHNVVALDIVRDYAKGNDDSARAKQGTILNDLTISKPDFFVDVSSTHRSDLSGHGGIEKFSEVKNYLVRNFNYLGNFDGVNLWRRKF